MQNLTSEKNVVYEAPDLNPIEGHVLVVFEQIGEGREFQSLIRPGQKFKKRKGSFIPFSAAPVYFAYAVSADPNLRLKFTDRVELQDHVHAIDLNYTVSYSVSDPRKIAEILHTDPLSRLQDEIELVIGDSVSAREWEMIRDNFRALRMELLTEDTFEMGRLFDFASDLGIRIKSIELNRRLLEGDTVLPRAKVKADQDKELARIEKDKAAHELELDQELKGRQRELQISADSKLLSEEQEIQSQKEMHRLQLDFQKKMLESFATGVGTLAQGTENADEFRRNAEAVLQTIQSFFQSKGAKHYQQTPDGNLLRGGAYQAIIGQLPESTGGILRVVYESYEQVNKLTCQHEEKNRLLSAILHLVAELMVGDKGDSEMIKRYSGEINELALNLRLHIAPDQFGFFRQFQDYDSLREYLK